MRLLAIAAVAVALGCGDSFSATTDNVAGDYHVTSFTTSDSAATVDWMTVPGTTFTISLAANGTTTGHIFVPGGGTGGADLDADMAGTWVLTRDIVTFNQSADTFVRNVAFIATQNRLTGDKQFSTTRVRITLSK